MLFNWFGYQLVAAYFENKALFQMQADLDNNTFSKEDLISIKVPLNLPYGPNSQKFEKAEGSIDMNGITYQYVQRRFYKDSLELLCIPNTAKTSIKNARDEFAKVANDFVNLNNSKKASNNHHKLVKYTTDDFAKTNIIQVSNNVFAFSLVYSTHVAAFISNHYLSCIEQPPELS
jgi:hypothetical protein